MITATFLGPTGTEHWLGFRDTIYIFPGKEPVDVDRDLALYCSTKITKTGKPLFEIIGLDGDPDADIPQLLGIQSEFELCPSSQQ